MNAWVETLIAVASQAWQSGDLGGAETAFRYVLGTSGRDGWVAYCLGQLAQLQGRPVDAIALLTAALVIDPDNGRAHNELAEALRAQNRLEAAVPHFERAIALTNGLDHAYGNLAATLRGLGRPEAALPWAQMALQRATDKAAAHCTLGRVLLHLNRHEEALRQFEQAAQGNPDCVAARYFEGVTRLAMGDMPAGWAGYEARLALSPRPGDTRHGQPRWDGTTPLDSRSIILHAAAGLGDTLQFVRFAPALAARGARVLLQVPSPLRTLLADLPGIHAVYTQDDALPPADLQCPLLSLPFALQTSLATLPAAPYLHAPAATAAAWAKRLGPWRKMRIGLAWAGDPRHPEDHSRSIRLEKLAPLLQHPEVEFHVVQRDIGPEDRAVLHQHLELADHSAALTDFSQTAGLLMQMDLVIAVDTAVIHLAGALGRPAWVLLPFAADWRWLRERADSPWYPSIRLFRQPRTGDWQSVLQTLADNLDQWSIQR